ncbi:MAG: TVP38/TMEM64 family protein [Oscillospiraceae bacterium]
MKLNRNMLIRLLIILGVLGLSICLIYFAFIKASPELLDIIREGDAEEIEHYLQSNSNVGGMLCTALLQIVAIVSLVIPSAPIQVAAGVVYGTFTGFAVCHLSSVLANTTIFTLARRLGEKMNALIPVGENSSKLDFILQSESPLYMTVIAFMVPILPNGIIPYIAAKTNMSIKRFAFAVYVGSFIPFFIMCAVGNKIVEGSFVAAAVLLGGLFVTVILLFKFRDIVLVFLKRYYRRLRKWVYETFFTKKK